MLLPISLFATEYAPWIGNFLEVETRISAAYQQFRHVNSSHRNFSYPSHDFFTNFNAGIAPDDCYDVQVDLLFADTRHRNYGFDSGKVTGRYFILNDIVGDPVSLTAGLSLILPIHSALRDIGSFHHGMAELEGHMAVGLETPYFTTWLQRQYAVFALGIATQGSPWLRVKYHFERALCNNFSLQFFFDSLFGLGRRSLRKHHFHGYGAIAHRSIDTGLKLSYTFDYCGILSVKHTSSGRMIFCNASDETILSEQELQQSVKNLENSHNNYFAL